MTTRLGRTVNIVVVFDEQNHVLSLKRGRTDPWMPGHWNFPGGYQEITDRSHASAAARELYEEAGIRVRPDALHLAFSTVIEGRPTNVYWIKFGRRPKVVMRDKEHSAFRWTSLQAVPKPAIPSVKKIQAQIEIESTGTKAKTNGALGTTALIAAAAVPTVVVPTLLKGYRPDLTYTERAVKGSLLGAAWGAFGIAAIGTAFVGMIPIVGIVALPMVPVLSIALPLLGYATYKLFKKPVAYRELPEQRQIAMAM